MKDKQNEYFAHLYDIDNKQTFINYEHLIFSHSIDLNAKSMIYQIRMQLFLTMII